MHAWCLRAAGWLVADAANGAAALFAVASFAPDVIVMDLRLLVLGGLEATRRLKANPHTQHIPVIALSAMDRGQAEILAMEAGCEGFVAKPCPPERLRAILENVIGGDGEGSSA